MSSKEGSVTQQIETEIAELRRRLRIMENDKKAYSDESQQMLKRQANLIDKLKDDNKSLCKELLKVNKERRASKERSGTLNQGNAEGEIKVLKDKINQEMLVQKELEDEMKLVQKQIIE